MPEAVIIEEIPSGTDGIGSGAIARREDEPIQKTEDGTEVADEPPPNAVKRPSVAESVEMYRGKVGVAGPTYEQIAHRAYELYLERGERSNGDREDWLAAENELSERYRDNGPA
jgi:hypothetical protein